MGTKPIGVKVDGDTVIIYFEGPEGARFWASSIRTNINAQYGKMALPDRAVLLAAERIRLYHMGRGCCDGTDIDACTIKRAAEQAAKATAARGRPREEDEYEGTAPTELPPPYCDDDAHIWDAQDMMCINCGMGRYHG